MVTPVRLDNPRQLVTLPSSMASADTLTMTPYQVGYLLNPLLGIITANFGATSAWLLCVANAQCTILDPARCIPRRCAVQTAVASCERKHNLNKTLTCV